MAYVRTVKTASGATAVQIVHSSHRGSREIEHIGSAHDAGELELLKVAAAQRLHVGQDSLDLGDGWPDAAVLPIRSTQSKHLWDALTRAWRVLGLEAACGSDEVFQALVLARIIEPTSKLDTIRVLEETGVAAPAYRTITRRLPVYATTGWRDRIAGACSVHVGLGPATLVLYDVTVRREALDV